MRPRVCAVIIAGSLAAAGCHDLSKIRLGEPAPTPGRCTVGQVEVPGGCAQAPPSCLKQTVGDPPREALAHSCGPGRNDSCCQYDLIEPLKDADLGTFYRSWDTSRDGTAILGWASKEDSMRARPVNLRTPYQLDRYEVTVGRFKAFYAQMDAWLEDSPNPEDGAGAYPPVKPGESPSVGAGWVNAWKKDTELWSVTRARFDQILDNPRQCDPDIARSLRATDNTDDDRPMTCVNWYEAFLFCLFDGGRLPTEAEWNFAATGGSEQRAYPWQVPPDPKTNVIDVSRLVTGDQYANVGPVGFRPRPVGSHAAGVGRFGQHDLAGNATEFVHDLSGDMICPEMSPGTGCLDGEMVYVSPPGTTDPYEITGTATVRLVNRVTRGGGFRFGWTEARTAFRQPIRNHNLGRFSDTGFRCARDVTAAR
jgi:formylglycine-generating enzyme required for sulfatase activity